MAPNQRRQADSANQLTTTSALNKYVVIQAADNHCGYLNGVASAPFGCSVTSQVCAFGFDLTPQTTVVTSLPSSTAASSGASAATSTSGSASSTITAAAVLNSNPTATVFTSTLPPAAGSILCCDPAKGNCNVQPTACVDLYEHPISRLCTGTCTADPMTLKCTSGIDLHCNRVSFGQMAPTLVPSDATLATTNFPGAGGWFCGETPIPATQLLISTVTAATATSVMTIGAKRTAAPATPLHKRDEDDVEDEDVDVAADEDDSAAPAADIESESTPADDVSSDDDSTATSEDGDDSVSIDDIADEEDNTQDQASDDETSIDDIVGGEDKDDSQSQAADNDVSVDDVAVDETASVDDADVSIDDIVDDEAAAPSSDDDSAPSATDDTSDMEALDDTDFTDYNGYTDDDFSAIDDDDDSSSPDDLERRNIAKRATTSTTASTTSTGPLVIVEGIISATPTALGVSSRAGLAEATTQWVILTPTMAATANASSSSGGTSNVTSINGGSDASSSGGSSKAGPIAGGVIGGLVVVGAIVGFFAWKARKSAKARRDAAAEEAARAKTESSGSQ